MRSVSTAVGAVILSAVGLMGPELVSNGMTGLGMESGAAYAKGGKDRDGKDRGGKDRGGKGSKPSGKTTSTGGKPTWVGGGKPTTKHTKAAPQSSPKPQSAPTVEKPKNLNAELKGLNSLKRNINGVMNSSDPKMTGFQEYIQASADLKELEAQIETDEKKLAELKALAEKDEPKPEDFTKSDGSLDDDAYQTAKQEWQDAQDDVTDLEKKIEDANAELKDLEDATSEDALEQAIVDGMNATGNETTTAEDLSPEVVEWVEEQMGVGEDEGLIDDYIAQQEEEAAAAAAAAEAEATPTEEPV
ncbi:hypothetical protein O2N63_03535 [Aliiroseovarius sp. KMU-50]|uniref:Uncharacterized protein n=1 Tax=Aliiroseovarius salicola TaxID=3009082 RepID=A0ABT4VY10_9RHOB|nr:hypothetical protein [Aliiroseovarius sp. KMU-50]MDA5093151.1 hypothetical protein [Aliiroseovarius sp. KMU-50]